MSLGLAGVYIIFLMFIPLCLWGMHKEPEHNGDISLMSMDDSNYLKGVSACGVFLAHSYNYLHTNNISNINLLIPFSLLGGMGVLMFLFTGGYGIYKSFEKTNKMQLKSYWYKRLTNVYIAAVIINAIIAVAICAVQNDWSITQIAITGFFGGWYINVVMLEYLSFCIAALITRDKKKILMLMLIFNLALFVLFTYLDLDARWRNGLFVYPFGIFVASYEEKLRKILLKKWKSIFAINATIFVFGGGIFTYYKGTLGADIMKNIAGLTPVDVCADAVLKILEHNSPCNVFHLYDTNLLPINIFYDTILERGINLTPVSNTLMTYIIKGILSDDSKKSIISGIVQDLDKDKKFTYISKVGLDATFTQKYLEAIGFNWSTFDSEYVNKCFDYFENVGFIDKNLEEH